MLADGLRHLLCGETAIPKPSNDSRSACEIPGHMALHLDALFKLSAKMTSGTRSAGLNPPWQCLLHILISIVKTYGMDKPLKNALPHLSVTPFLLVDTFMCYIQQERIESAVDFEDTSAKVQPSCTLLWFQFLQLIAANMLNEDVIKYIWDSVIAWIIETRSKCCNKNVVDAFHGMAWQDAAHVQLTCINSLHSLPRGPKAVEELVDLLHEREANESSERRHAIWWMCLNLLGSTKNASKLTLTGLVPLFHEIVASLSTSTALDGVSCAQGLCQTQKFCSLYLLSLHRALQQSDPKDEPLSSTLWEDCLIVLMKASLTPCAPNFGVIPELWSSLAQVLDGAALEETTAGLYEILRGLAATEAVHPPSPPKGATLQFTDCMASFLAAIPKQRFDTDKFFHNAMSNLFKQMESRRESHDVVLLTYLLRLAVHSQESICSIDLVIEAVSVLVKEVQGLAMSGSEDDKLPYEDQCRAAWLLTALAYGVAYMDMVAGEMAMSLDSGTTKMLDIACKVAAYLLVVGEDAPFCGPAARLLYTLWHQRPRDDNILATLKTLLPHFPDKRFIGHPQTAAYVAKLAPAFCDCAPTALFQALLTETTSPSLAYLGKEAYVSYARVCEQSEYISAVLPEYWLSSTDGLLSPEKQSCLERYLAYSMCESSKNSVGNKKVHDLRNAPILAKLDTSWIHLNSKRVDATTRPFINGCQWPSPSKDLHRKRVCRDEEHAIHLSQLAEMKTTASRLQNLSERLMEQTAEFRMRLLFEKQDLEVIKECRDALNSLLVAHDDSLGNV